MGKCIKVEEMAKQLGISRSNAYELCRRKGFPAILISPRRIIIPVDALDEWLKKQSGMQDQGGTP